MIHEQKQWYLKRRLGISTQCMLWGTCSFEMRLVHGSLKAFIEPFSLPNAHPFYIQIIMASKALVHIYTLLFPVEFASF